MVTSFSFLSLTRFISTIPSITRFLHYHSLNAHCHIFLSLNHPMFGQIQWRCNMSIPFLPFLIYSEASWVMMSKKFKLFYLLVSWVLNTEEILSHAFIMKKNYSCMYRSHRCNKFCLVSNILIKKNTFLKCDQSIPTCWYIINCGLSRESIFKSIIILLYDHRRIYTDISHWVLSNKDFI